jgi:L-ascorbate metabolism protein UlaG (beta-lactamase superfamily)
MSGRPPPFPVSDHCDGRRFFNPGGHVNRTWFEVLRWKLHARPGPWPVHVAIAPRPAPPPPAGDALTATWINHCTFLLQTRHGAVLTDPVYSDRAGPGNRLGPRRVHAPGIAFPDLPGIGAVLLSHDHYDHCDLPTLARLAALNPQPVAVTPLGNGPLLLRAGFAAAKVVELDWWETHGLGPEWHVQVVPARHWSNRLSGHRNGRLWGGLLLRAGRRTALYSGDTAHDAPLYRTIRERCGAPDLALLPIGGYEPRWFMAPQHCNPAEAVDLHRAVGARQSIGMHWGTFPLTDEARDEPPAALAAALAQAGVPAAEFRVLQPGESVTL